MPSPKPLPNLIAYHRSNPPLHKKLPENIYHPNICCNTLTEHVYYLYIIIDCPFTNPLTSLQEYTSSLPNMCLYTVLNSLTKGGVFGTSDRMFGFGGCNRGSWDADEWPCVVVFFEHCWRGRFLKVVWICKYQSSPAHRRQVDPP